MLTKHARHCYMACLAKQGVCAIEVVCRCISERETDYSRIDRAVSRMIVNRLHTRFRWVN